MVVLIVERVTPSLRGELTRWLTQPKTGVFVGRLTGRVRDKLWRRVSETRGGGAAILIHTDSTEQGFRVLTVGKTAKAVADFDGLFLFKTRASR